VIDKEAKLVIKFNGGLITPIQKRLYLFDTLTLEYTWQSIENRWGKLKNNIDTNSTSRKKIFAKYGGTKKQFNETTQQKMDSKLPPKRRIQQFDGASTQVQKSREMSS
jgi:hypothetical protein